MLHVLCRGLGQFEAAAAAGARSLMADFADIRQYRDAVRVARRADAEIFLATPRIHKSGESGVFQAMQRHEPDGLLVRNLAGLAFCRQHKIAAVADFSLNAANELSVQWLCQHGARRVTASYDLSRKELQALAAAVLPEWLEVVVYQHMPMFHMQHCVFCAVLSPGKNQLDCGRPCDRHATRLRDRMGAEHVLETDVGCRNTLYNARPQSTVQWVPSLVAAGVRHFRIELAGRATPNDLAELMERMKAEG